MKKIFTGMIICLFMSAGCTPFVPVINMADVTQEKRQESNNIKTFTIEESNNYPEIDKYIGNIVTYSCKFLPWDDHASKEDATAQLKIKALDLGANAIVGITYTVQGFESAMVTNCYETVQASGSAVILKITKNK